MKVFGITGWKNSGKTTLIVQLIEIMNARGLKVSTVKHAHHEFDIDREGKDSWRHRKAGASEVLVASVRRWALIHEYRDEEEASLDQLLSRLTDCDLVLVEGFKSDAHEKLQVFRGQEHETLLAPEDESIVAVVTDQDLGGRAGAAKILPLDAPGRVVDFILARVSLD